MQYHDYISPCRIDTGIPEYVDIPTKTYRATHTPKGTSAKSIIEPTADLALCQGIAEMLLNSLPKHRTKTVRAKMQRVYDVCGDAMQIWFSENRINQAAVRKVKQRCDNFKRIYFSETYDHVYTSFMLALLEDRLDMQKKDGDWLHNNEQRKALKKCVNAIRALHNHFDHGDVPIAYYNQAAFAAEGWRKC
jgi:hypothetical protein